MTVGLALVANDTVLAHPNLAKLIAEQITQRHPDSAAVVFQYSRAGNAWAELSVNFVRKADRWTICAASITSDM